MKYIKLGGNSFTPRLNLYLISAASDDHEYSFMNSACLDQLGAPVAHLQRQPKCQPQTGHLGLL